MRGFNAFARLSDCPVVKLIELTIRRTLKDGNCSEHRPQQGTEE